MDSFTQAVNMNNTTIAGTAIVPEGLFQNEFVYDFVMKLGYETTSNLLQYWGSIPV